MKTEKCRRCGNLRTDIKEKLNKASKDIKEAEKVRDHQKVNNLIEEFNKLTKEL